MKTGILVLCIEIIILFIYSIYIQASKFITFANNSSMYNTFIWAHLLKFMQMPDVLALHMLSPSDVIRQGPVQIRLNMQLPYEAPKSWLIYVAFNSIENLVYHGLHSFVALIYCVPSKRQIPDSQTLLHWTGCGADATSLNSRLHCKVCLFFTAEIDVTSMDCVKSRHPPNG